jgi:Cation transporting ATPase, C-terminus
MTGVRAGTHAIAISHEDKVLFPEDGITKGDLVAYYRKIGATMLPHVKGRPVMMQRFPDGIGRPGFYQKDAGTELPKWIHRVKVKKVGGHVTHVVCDDAASLVYLANQACITPYVWLSRADHLELPDQISLFQTAWFVESLATQTVVIFVIRTRRVPFFSSPPGRALALTSLACVIVGAIIPFSPAAALFGFRPLPVGFFAILATMVVTYLALVELAKAIFFAHWRQAVSRTTLTDRWQRRISRVRTRWSAAH